MDTSGHTVLSEDYVSFEVAKLLKEKGFDGLCYCHEFTDYEGNFTTYHTEYPENWNQSEPCVSIPTLGMAMKWLREVHNILITISVGYYGAGCVRKYDWSVCCMRKNGIGYPLLEEPMPTQTYEKAVEAALKYSLENLI